MPIFVSGEDSDGEGPAQKQAESVAEEDLSLVGNTTAVGQLLQLVAIFGMYILDVYRLTSLPTTV